MILAMGFFFLKKYFSSEFYFCWLGKNALLKETKSYVKWKEEEYVFG